MSGDAARLRARASKTPVGGRWWTLVGDMQLRNPSGHAVHKRSALIAYSDGAE